MRDRFWGEHTPLVDTRTCFSQSRLSLQPAVESKSFLAVFSRMNFCLHEQSRVPNAFDGAFPPCHCPHSAHCSE